MENLVERIKEIALKAHDYRKKQVLEPGTKAGLIEPLFREIGWDFSDVDCVEPEFQVVLDGKNNPVDYAFKVENKPFLFLEAKRINLDIKVAIKDGTEKAIEKKISWLIASNGDTIAVLKIDERIPEPERIAFQISLSDTVDDDLKLTEAAGLLSLLKPENIESGKLQTFADDQLKKARIIKVIDELILSEEFLRLVQEKYKKKYKDDLTDPKFLKEIVQNINVGAEEKSIVTVHKPKRSDPKIIEQRQTRLFSRPGRTEKKRIKEHIKDKAELWREFIQRKRMSREDFKELYEFIPHAVAGFTAFLLANGLATHVADDPYEGAIYEINKEIIPKIEGILDAS
jgi:predicted type IV restriction endonuclease